MTELFTGRHTYPDGKDTGSLISFSSEEDLIAVGLACLDTPRDGGSDSEGPSELDAWRTSRKRRVLADPTHSQSTQACLQPGGNPLLIPPYTGNRNQFIPSIRGDVQSYERAVHSQVANMSPRFQDQGGHTSPTNGKDTGSLISFSLAHTMKHSHTSILMPW
eukprot:Filipodium_phascolosomae@DN2577_c0_g1_i16.p1